MSPDEGSDGISSPPVGGGQSSGSELRKVVCWPNEFFRYCAGASRDILARCPGPERKRQEILGALVLVISAFAFVAAAYGVWSFTQTWWVALLGGALWASLIFCIDRMLIQAPSLTKSRFSRKGYRPAFLVLLPRVLLAGVIGYMIAVPVELLMFNREIVLQHTSDVQSQIKGKTTEISARRSVLDAEFCATWGQKDRVYAVQAKIDELQKRIENSEDGRDVTHVRKCGPICKTWIEEQDRQRTELNRLNREQAECPTKDNPRLADDPMLQRLQREVNEAEAQLAISPSFLQQLKARAELAENDHTVQQVMAFITVAFMLVDIIPVLMKLLSSGGAYDQYVLHESSVARMKIAKREAEEGEGVTAALAKTMEIARSEEAVRQTAIQQRVHSFNAFHDRPEGMLVLACLVIVALFMLVVLYDWFIKSPAPPLPMATLSSDPAAKGPVSALVAPDAASVARADMSARQVEQQPTDGVAPQDDLSARRADAREAGQGSALPQASAQPAADKKVPGNGEKAASGETAPAPAGPEKQKVDRSVLSGAHRKASGKRRVLDKKPSPDESGKDQLQEGPKAANGGTSSAARSRDGR